jgi:hypothetical protein
LISNVGCLFVISFTAVRFLSGESIQSNIADSKKDFFGEVGFEELCNSVVGEGHVGKPLSGRGGKYPGLSSGGYGNDEDIVNLDMSEEKFQMILSVSKNGGMFE